MIVRDFMVKTVMAVAPNTTVPEAARIMLANRVSALPVTGPAGELIGIVSERDLMRRAEIGTDKHSPWWLRSLVDRSDLAAAYTKAHALHVRDVMTREVTTVEEETPLDEIVDLFERHNIKRLPVLARGKLTGIISRFDLLRVVATIALPDRAIRPSDRDLKQQLLATLKAEGWWRGRDADILVQGGTAYLWGIVSSQQEREAARVIAERIPGIRGIKNHMAVAAEPTSAAASGREAELERSP